MKSGISSEISTFKLLNDMPKGLNNPKYHCYINSVLQIWHRIFLQLTEHIHTNNDREGRLVKILTDCIYPNGDNDLSNFKHELARYDHFFDGSVQRDAYECFASILKIFHIGTKESLIADNLLLEDDQFTFSLSTQLFSYTTKRTLQCTSCRYLTTSYNQSHVLFVYPCKDSNIKSMLENSMISNLTKKCNCCKFDTNHDEVVLIEQPSRILVVVLKRFNLALTGGKNKNIIHIDREILINSSNYHLIGSIHHHGNTITSGHYTANVYHKESAYTCNDSHIMPLNNFEPSDSVYMLFYAYGNYPSQQIQRMGPSSHGTGTSSA